MECCFTSIYEREVNIYVNAMFTIFLSQTSVWKISRHLTHCYFLKNFCRSIHTSDAHGYEEGQLLRRPHPGVPKRTAHVSPTSHIVWQNTYVCLFTENVSFAESHTQLSILGNVLKWKQHSACSVYILCKREYWNLDLVPLHSFAFIKICFCSETTYPVLAKL